MIKISENVKKLMVVNICIILICSCFMYAFVIKQNKAYTKALNSTITKVVAIVKEKCPSADEVEIIQALRNTDEYLVKENILTKYGLDGEGVYIKSLEKQMKLNIIEAVTLVTLFGMAYVVIFVIYQRKQDKKLSEINEYLKQINDRNYELKIEDNSENELAKLRNELYKTTVLLKETAENSETEKKKLSDSLADISHQLKTPLTSIRILLDNIEDNANMDEETRKDFLKEISLQIDWISSLVILLLKLARLDAGAVKLELEDIDANKLVQEVINSLAILIELKKVNIVLDIPTKAKFIADYKWQKEAISNILKNAIEHSKEGSNIYINVETSSVMLKIKIKDEGDGIDKEDRRHIFERFYKSKNSSETSIGIGLPLAKTIIEKSNGYVTVESEVEKGTEFVITYLK